MWSVADRNPLCDSREKSATSSSDSSLENTHRGRNLFQRAPQLLCRAEFALELLQLVSPDLVSDAHYRETKLGRYGRIVREDAPAQGFRLPMSAAAQTTTEVND